MRASSSNASEPDFGPIDRDNQIGTARLRILTLAGLGCVGGVAVMVGKDSDCPHEQVWWGRRGPFSTDRAIAWSPMIACLGSGAIAALVAYRYPYKASAVWLEPRIHDLIALPISILLAFRFQNAYERWWSSRHNMEAVAANVVSVALCASTNVDVSTPLVGADGSKPLTLNQQQGMAVEMRHRILVLLDAYCALVERAVSGGAFPEEDGHSIEEWLSAEDILPEEDVRQMASSKDALLWCTNAIFAAIHTGQSLSMYTPELAAGMYAAMGNLQLSVQNCVMVHTQKSPGPFVVHMRTLLFLFCVTFPFTLIGYVKAVWIFPMQALVSFSYMGAEFCSRQMEDPFGFDSGDIPTRRILEKAREQVRTLKDSPVRVGIGSTR